LTPPARRRASRAGMLFFAHLGKRVRRYVSAPFFDLVWRVHECVFGVLALESEPVDPRL